MTRQPDTKAAMKLPWSNNPLLDVPENEALPTRKQMAEMLWASIQASKYMNSVHTRLPYDVGTGASFRTKMEAALRELYSCYEMVLRDVSPSDIKWTPPDVPEETPDDTP